MDNIGTEYSFMTVITNGCKIIAIMTTDAGRYYYLRLMSKKISLINDPKATFTKPKFVQWADKAERKSASEQNIGLEVGFIKD